MGTFIEMACHPVTEIGCPIRKPGMAKLNSTPSIVPAATAMSGTTPISNSVDRRLSRQALQRHCSGRPEGWGWPCGDRHSTVAACHDITK